MIGLIFSQKDQISEVGVNVPIFVQSRLHRHICVYTWSSEANIKWSSSVNGYFFIRQVLSLGPEALWVG